MSESSMTQFTAELEEYTVTAVWKIKANSPEEARGIASKEGLFSARKVDVKQTSRCRFCGHPKAKEKHEKAGASDCGCSCNH